MTFAFPDLTKTATAQMLRDLEQSCARTTQAEVKAALIVAAKELETWQRLAEDTARQLEEAANVRISQMATTSKVDEVQRGVQRTMLDLAARFRELT